MPKKAKRPSSNFLSKVVNAAGASLGYAQKGIDTRSSIESIGPQYGFGAVSGGILGKTKPTNVSFTQLRAIEQYDAVISICVNKIKKAVSMSSWSIQPRKGTTPNAENIKKANELFLLINSTGESLRTLLDQTVEDLLVLDAGVIEKVFNVNGDLVELYAVDGATIRPKYDKSGKQDPDEAYVQVINSKVVATFRQDELIYMMANPKTNIRRFGYGESTIESILLQVNASLQADMYNARIFSEDNVPPGLLDLGDRTDAEAGKFAELYNATVIGNTHKMKMVWGGGGGEGKSGGIKFIPFNNTNKDMQYVEYIDWLTRLKLAAFGLSPLDANITQDINRSTAEVMAALANSEGVMNVKKLVEEFFNREILITSGLGDTEFKFDTAASLSDKETQAKVDKIYIEASVTTAKQVAEREGLEVVEDIVLLEESDEDDVVINRGDNGKSYFPPIY